jgi:hypothetical protein
LNAYFSQIRRLTGFTFSTFSLMLINNIQC